MFYLLVEEFGQEFAYSVSTIQKVVVWYYTITCVQLWCDHAAPYLMGSALLTNVCLINLPKKIPFEHLAA